MCRLLGILSSAPVDFRMLLAERARSLAVLGAEHADGWGMAAFGNGRWSVHKGTRPASHDARFHRRAATLRGEVLVSHVRKRTVGATREENTHPFSNGRWVFAHNGTIEDRAWVRDRVSARRAREIVGDTDSELFFACVLSRLDELALCEASPAHRLDEALSDLLFDCRRRDRFGSINFLLSNGERCWVHRFGRPLFVLERGPRDESPSKRVSSVFLASEPMTSEAWREIADGTMLRVERSPAVHVTTL
jgi:predicted glutamine amidotransferase